MTKPAKPYYANPGPSQERRNILNVGCAIFFAALAVIAVVMAIALLPLVLSQQPIF